MPHVLYVGATSPHTKMTVLSDCVLSILDIIQFGPKNPKPTWNRLSCFLSAYVYV